MRNPFDSVFDQNSEILVVGTFPSVKSREQCFYYGHPQNRFWRVLSSVFNEPVPETIAQKRELLRRNRVALWDALYSCDIEGSSDLSIKNVVPNDFSEIFENANIKRVLCNGSKAFDLFREFVTVKTSAEVQRMPSTSPANAAWTLERLIEMWSVGLNIAI